eukprot:TRINITY_DN19999_c0_g1_i1.p1 TRINITY_DN19999_c0_g1~~TRINITY_DN19999_c0_g1_i1.p1  ORF type:complete len:578 (+),score=161.57 TRINITY_DN19999_c0_g1_i1:90-1736(+)
MTATVRTYDVAVVGAGLSGLYCSRLLRGAGLRVILLEGRERVGGRQLSEHVEGPCRPWERLDKGAAWIGPTQTLVTALAAECGADTVGQYCSGRNVLQLGNTRVDYEGDIPWNIPGGLPALAELQLLLWRVDWMASSVPVDCPERAPRAKEWDAVTIAQWLEKNVSRQELRETVHAAVGAVFVEEAHNMSFLWFLMYVHAAGGFQALTDAAGGAQDRRFVNGSMTLSERLATQLAGEALTLGATVTSIVKVPAPGGLFHLSASDGPICKASQVVVALSPARRCRIKVSLEGGAALRHTAVGEAATPSACIKAAVAYSRPHWRDKGFTGSVAFSKPDPVGLVMDTCTQSGGAAVAVFFSGRGAQHPPEDRRAAALRVLRSAFGAEMSEVENYVEQDWPNDGHTATGCVFSSAPGALTGDGAGLYDSPLEGLHWAGTEAAVRWKGYMEGALEAGVYGALAAAAGLSQRPLQHGSELAELQKRYKSAAGFRASRLPGELSVVRNARIASSIAVAIAAAAVALISRRGVRRGMAWAVCCAGLLRALRALRAG